MTLATKNEAWLLLRESHGPRGAGRQPGVVLWDPHHEPAVGSHLSFNRRVKGVSQYWRKNCLHACALPVGWGSRVEDVLFGREQRQAVGIEVDLLRAHNDKSFQNHSTNFTFSSKSLRFSELDDLLVKSHRGKIDARSRPVTKTCGKDEQVHATLTLIPSWGRLCRRYMRTDSNSTTAFCTTAAAAGRERSRSFQQKSPTSCREKGKHGDFTGDWEEKCNVVATK